jgi:4-diphosphocytidyl-2-C-methyl-D-erythritol kinase
MVQAVRAGDVPGVLRRLGNVLEPVTAGAHPEIGEIREDMLAYGAEPVMMSGSGPTVFGFVKNREAGEQIAGILQSLCLEAAVAELVGRKSV